MNRNRVLYIHDNATATQENNIETAMEAYSSSTVPQARANLHLYRLQQNSSDGINFKYVKATKSKFKGFYKKGVTQFP